MSSSIALFIFAVLAVLVYLSSFFEKAVIKEYVARLSPLQAALTIIAIVFTAAWYFIQRPDSAKLKFDQTVSGFAIKAGTKAPQYALIVAEISFNNVGASALNLKGRPYSLFVQQVTPLTTSPVKEYGEKNKTNSDALEIHQADTWALLARRDGLTDSRIESGETENLYFRVILPCKPDLRVYFTSWFHKPKLWSDFLFARANDDVWVKQSLLDLSKECARAPSRK